jgi:hypothetical protein
MNEAVKDDAVPIIAALDARRRALRTPVLSCLALGFVFVATTAISKSDASWFSRVPWRSDPYDVVTSFVILIVPIQLTAASLRVILCRQSVDLPLSRLLGVVNSCWSILTMMIIATSSELVATGLAIRVVHWSAPSLVQISLVPVFFVAELVLSVRLRRATSQLGLRHATQHKGPDGLSDVMAQIRGVITYVRVPSRRLARGLDVVEAWSRRHPVVMAFAASSAIGLSLGLSQGVSESYGWVLTLVTGAVLTMGLFALIVTWGAVSGFVYADRSMGTVARRCMDAVVAGTFAMLVALAFRSNLARVVDANSSGLRLNKLVLLMLGAALSGAAITVIVESVLKSDSNSRTLHLDNSRDRSGRR